VDPTHGGPVLEISNFALGDFGPPKNAHISYFRGTKDTFEGPKK